MPFAVMPADIVLIRSEVAPFGGYRGIAYRSGFAQTFDVTRRQLDVLRFGQAEYHLRRRAQGVFYPGDGSEPGEFSVEGFAGTVVGQGRTPDEAHGDWLKRFHVTFQQLYVMRPFEMSDAERQLWKVIESQVDVERYRLSEPLVVRQQGRIKRARPYPELVEWEDGTREKVSLKWMPGEFATYQAGQPFEAVVHRHPVSHKILKVEYVKRLPAEPRSNAEESRRLWDSLPTSQSLGDADWE